MNSAYRQGYRDGLTLAREHGARGLTALTADGMLRYAQAQYGKANKATINRRKAGFRDGYTAGVEATTIERSRVTVRTNTHTETGGDDE